MPVSQVNIHSDVYWTCLSHALSTEKEEIMGLFIGSHKHSPMGVITTLESLVPLRRSDKRADRVEISPEQQIEAANRAEKLRDGDGRQLQVCGWYHSHPHITVHPSHVDVNTQYNYQAMDPNFVGLIFSAFSNAGINKTPGKIEVKCFQAEYRDGTNESVDVALNILPRRTSPSCLKALISLPRIVHDEQVEARQAAEDGTYPELVTQISNDATLTKALCGITEVVSAPLLDVLGLTLDTYQNELNTRLTARIDIPSSPERRYQRY